MNSSWRRIALPRRLVGLLTATASCVAFGALVAAPAGAAVNGSNNAGDLGAAMSVDPLAGASLGTSYVAPFPTGIGDSPLDGFPTHGSTFTVESTGNAALADDPNSSESTGLNKGKTGDFGPNAYDYQVLKLDVNVPQGENCLGFDFRFLSDEFPEFVGTSYNDTFLAQLDTLGWSANPDTAGVDVTGAPNFAVAAGEKIDVNTVGVTGVSPEQAAGTTYDAGTQLLTARTTVSPGPHSVFLSTTDLGDGIYDSAAFLDNLRFENIPPSQCEPPFEAELGKTKVKCKGPNCKVPVTCNLPVDLGTPCSNVVELFAGSAPPKKSIKIAKGTATVAPGATGSVKLKLTKKGKKLAKKKKKLKGEIKITNAEQTASDATPVSVKL